jgi:hypothetical protein
LQRPCLCRGPGAAPLAFNLVAEKKTNSAASARVWAVVGVPCGACRALCQGESGSGASLGALSVASLTGKRHASAGCPRLMADAFRGVVVGLRCDGGGCHVCSAE